MHYPVQPRVHFAKWVDDGFPSTAVVEVNHEELHVPADLMLRRMRRCSDVLPDGLALALGERLGRENGLAGRSYGEAARRLLAATP